MRIGPRRPRAAAAVRRVRCFRPSNRDAGGRAAARAAPGAPDVECTNMQLELRV